MVANDALLRRAGLRVTPGRVAVLVAIEEFPHSPADILWRKVQARIPGISVQSVHNVLGDLTGVGLLRRVEPAGSAALYERYAGDNHHHMVCSSCGDIADVSCLQGEAPCLTPGHTAGFEVHMAEIIFWGRCARCAGDPEHGSASLPPYSLSIHTNHQGEEQ